MGFNCPCNTLFATIHFFFFSFQDLFILLEEAWMSPSGMLAAGWSRG